MLTTSQQNERVKSVSIANSLSQKSCGKNSQALIQRVIRSSPPGPGQLFFPAGRSGRHNSAANRRALAGIIAHRAANPNPMLRHVNNEFEMGAVPGALHIAHHISDENVQARVATAANQHNLGNPAAWVPVMNMIAGINPAASPVPLPLAFTAAANAAFAQANARLVAIMAIGGAIPHNPASRSHLTALASAIANSPMNLHYGLGQTNMSIGQHGDPNSFPVGAPGPLTRRLSWRSLRMAASAGPANLHYRTHAAAAAMPGTVAAAHAATFVAPGPLPAPVVHSSGSSTFFTALQ